MKPDRGGRDSAGMESSGQPASDLDNISHSTTFAFRLLANLNELRTNSNNNLCDVEIVAGKGKIIVKIYLSYMSYILNNKEQSCNAFMFID